MTAGIAAGLKFLKNLNKDFNRNRSIREIKSDYDILNQTGSCSNIMQIGISFFCFLSFFYQMIYAFYSQDKHKS